VLADETADIAGVEQLSLCAWHLDAAAGCVREDFLQFVQKQRAEAAKQHRFAEQQRRRKINAYLRRHRQGAGQSLLMCWQSWALICSIFAVKVMTVLLLWADALVEFRRSSDRCIRLLCMSTAVHIVWIWPFQMRAPYQLFVTALEWVSEWVSSFLTAHQHIKGHLVP